MKINTKDLSMFLAFALLGFVNTAFALEMQYPEIFGHKVTNASEGVEFLAYAFYFVIALGAVIVFCVLVSAGIDMVMAGGEASKITSARNKIMGSFIGLIILFCSYLILNTIDSNLTTIKLKQLNCDNSMSGLEVCVDITKKQGDMYKKYSQIFLSSMADAGLLEGEKIEIKKYNNLKEVWTFPEKEYQGIGTKIFDSRTNKEFPKEITSLVKSYKIIPYQEGIYFYDQTDFNIKEGAIAPLFTTTSVADFISFNFDNKTQSIDIGAPRWEKEKIMPSAVLFPEPRYRGVCTMVEQLSTDLDKLGISSYTSGQKFGKNQVSSAIIFTTKFSFSTAFDDSLGKVIFYNTKNCGQSEVDKEEGEEVVGEKPAECPIQIAAGDGAFEQLISAACPQISTIRSFRIDGASGGVVVRNANQRCQYWTIDDVDGKKGNCIANIETSDVFNPALGGIKPISFMVFPINK